MRRRLRLRRQPGQLHPRSDALLCALRKLTVPDSRSGLEGGTLTTCMWLLQYCGIDSESPKRISPFALDESRSKMFPFLSSQVDKISSGVQGMAIRSKCFDYSTDGKRCPRSGSYAKMPRIIDESPIDYKDEKGNVYHQLKFVDYPNYPPEEDDRGFCGKIESWAPARREWAGSVTPARSEEALARTSALQGTPASCTKQVKATIKGADQCTYKGAYFTVPTTTCDQDHEGPWSCMEACIPPGEDYSSYSYIDCTVGDLDGDEAKYCVCLRECNRCVQSNGGCAPDPDSDNGYCAECPPDSPPPPPPPPPTPTSAFQCSKEDAPPSEEEEWPCKSACRGCLVAAMKTSCQCQDKTGSEEYDISFGMCSSAGDFDFKLEKDYDEIIGSRAHWLYRAPQLTDRSLVRVQFQSPAVAWEGHCDGTSTTCKVCRDFQYGGQEEHQVHG